MNLKKVPAAPKPPSPPPAEEISEVLCRRSAALLTVDSDEDGDWSDDDSTGGGGPIFTELRAARSPSMEEMGVVAETRYRAASLEGAGEGGMAMLNLRDSEEYYEKEAVEEEAEEERVICFSAPSSNRNRLQKLQQEVEQAKSTLQENISKVVTRGEKLDHLDEKAEALQVQAFAFQKAVRKIPKQHRPLDDDLLCFGADFAEEAMSSDDSLASFGSLILEEELSEEGDQLTLLPRSLDEGRKRKGERYPEVRVAQLEGLFQNQHDTGYWELDCLDLLQLDSERVRNFLEQSGCKSLGQSVCTNLLRLVATLVILKILSKVLEHLFPLSFSPR
jgi:hypothetical protein